MLDESSLDRLTEVLTERAMAKGLPPVGARELAAGFVADAAQEKTKSGGPPGTLGLMVRHYVIRKDDLALFDSVTSALTTAAGAGFFIGTEPKTAAEVGIVVSLLKLLRDLWKKGAVLGDDKILVLTVLRTRVSSSSPGLTAAELLAAVNSSGAPKDMDWLQEQLQALSKFPVPAGGTKEFVSRDGLGRWRAHV